VLPFPDATAQSGRYLAYKREADRSRRMAYGLAASVLVLVGAVTLAYRKLGPETYQTQVGEQRELQLADGTIVDIAPNSRLRVRFHAAERDIELLSGAALFHVAHNAERPFIVSTAQGRARAVGTAFSVDQRGPDMIVTVVEGRVAVSGPSAPPAAKSSQATRADRADGSVTIGANQQVRVDQSGALTPVLPIEGEREVSWAYGRLSFENETIAEVVDKFNQYNRARIRLNDPALASKRISGNFRASDIESFAQFVHSVAGAPVSRGENDEIVIGRDGEIPQAEVRH
jgi:transmembrane sensor